MNGTQLKSELNKILKELGLTRSGIQLAIIQRKGGLLVEMENNPASDWLVLIRPLVLVLIRPVTEPGYMFTYLKLSTLKFWVVADRSEAMVEAAMDAPVQESTVYMDRPMFSLADLPGMVIRVKPSPLRAGSDAKVPSAIAQLYDRIRLAKNGVAICFNDLCITPYKFPHQLETNEMVFELPSTLEALLKPY